MRISDWSSDVCSSDLNAFGDADDQFHLGVDGLQNGVGRERRRHIDDASICTGLFNSLRHGVEHRQVEVGGAALAGGHAADHLGAVGDRLLGVEGRSEEHTSELQSLMRISYAVFCLKKKNQVAQ